MSKFNNFRSHNLGVLVCHPQIGNAGKFKIKSMTWLRILLNINIGDKRQLIAMVIDGIFMLNLTAACISYFNALSYSLLMKITFII